jgi:hypothetical protein
MNHRFGTAAALGIVALLATVISAGETTLITSFEQPADMDRVAGLSHKELVTGLATKGRASLGVTFTAQERSLDLTHLLPSDWQGYTYLRMDVYNPGLPCVFTLRVDDALYDPKDPAEKHTISSWYHRARPGWSTLEFVIPGLAEDADLSQIKGVWLRCESQLARPQPIGIDNVRFVRGGGVTVYEPPKRPVARRVTVVPGNFIANGNFELGLQDWGAWGRWENGQYEFSCGLDENAFQGESSAAILCDVPGRGGIFTDALRDVQPGLYRLSYAVKATDGAVARALLNGASVNGDRTIPGLPPRWRVFSYYVTVPDGAKDVRLYFFNVGAGILYVDGVSLVSATGEVQPKAPASAVPQKPAHVEVIQSVIYVKGEPFFPIGIYGCYDPSLLQGTGFNLCLGNELMSTPVELLDACHRAGLMSMFNLTGLMRGHRPENVREEVENVKGHPSVLGWYLCDEPDMSTWNVPPDEVALATRLLHGATQQPVASVVMGWAESNLYRYQGALDILATDIYPIRSDGQPSDLTAVAHGTDVAKRATGGHKPVWLVLQATDKATPQQEYGVTYLAITHGADGILYFAYSEELRKSEAWKALVDISLELQELSPYLTSPTSSRVVKVSDARIHWMLKESPKVYCLIAVNSTAETLQKVTWDLPFAREGAPLLVPFEARGGHIKNGAITDEFGPYQRHIYVIEK